MLEEIGRFLDKCPRNHRFVQTKTAKMVEIVWTPHLEIAVLTKKTVKTARFDAVYGTLFGQDHENRQLVQTYAYGHLLSCSKKKVQVCKFRVEQKGSSKAPFSSYIAFLILENAGFSVQHSRLNDVGFSVRAFRINDAGFFVRALFSENAGCVLALLECCFCY